MLPVELVMLPHCKIPENFFHFLPWYIPSCKSQTRGPKLLQKQGMKIAISLQRIFSQVKNSVNVRRKRNAAHTVDIIRKLKVPGDSAWEWLFHGQLRILNIPR